MDILYNKFRKATIGGFNRKDVIDYIEKMQNEFFQYKVQTEKTVNELNEKIRQLEVLTVASSDVDCQDVSVNEDENRTQVQELMPADEINIATGKLKNVADELCQSLSDFIEKLSENCLAVTLNVPFESSEEPEYTDEVIPDNVQDVDKAQSILNTVSSIFIAENKSEPAKEKLAEHKTESKTKSVKDILSSVSFVC